MHIYCFRYMWRVEGSDQIRFKIVTDTLDGLKLFDEQLLNLPGLILAGREYLHELDVSRLAQVEQLYKKEVSSDD